MNKYFQRGDTCMWESIYPTQSAITQQQKLQWSNISIGLPVDVNIVLKTDFIWIVHSPNLYVNNQYPQKDHTINQRAGRYLLLRNEQPRSPGDRAVLMSDRYDIDPKNRSFCVSFYYYINSPNLYFPTKLELFQSEDYRQVIKIKQISDFQMSKDWTKVSVTAQPLNKTSTIMWFYLVRKLL